MTETICEIPSKKHAVELGQHREPQEILTHCYFKPLNFAVACYPAIDNLYSGKNFWVIPLTSEIKLLVLSLG